MPEWWARPASSDVTRSSGRGFAAIDLDQVAVDVAGLVGGEVDDDPAVSLSEELFDGFLGAEERAFGVDVDSFAPSAHAFAMPRPNPELDPVTTTTLSASLLPMVIHVLTSGGGVAAVDGEQRAGGPAGFGGGEEHSGVGLDWTAPEVVDAVQVVTSSSLAIFASPTYKATYTGLLKLFLDRFGAGQLDGVVAVPLMLGGDWQHALAGEVHLKPVLAEIGAIVPTKALYLIDRELDDAAALTSWLDAAVPRLAGLGCSGVGCSTSRPTPAPRPRKPRTSARADRDRPGHR